MNRMDYMMSISLALVGGDSPGMRSSEFHQQLSGSLVTAPVTKTRGASNRVQTGPRRVWTYEYLEDIMIKMNCNREAEKFNNISLSHNSPMFLSNLENFVTKLNDTSLRGVLSTEGTSASSTTISWHPHVYSSPPKSLTSHSVVDILYGVSPSKYIYSRQININSMMSS